MWAPDYPDWLLAETAETQKREKRTGKDRGKEGEKIQSCVCNNFFLFVLFCMQGSEAMTRMHTSPYTYHCSLTMRGVIFPL